MLLVWLYIFCDIVQQNQRLAEWVLPTWSLLFLLTVLNALKHLTHCRLHLGVPQNIPKLFLLGCHPSVWEAQLLGLKILKYVSRPWMMSLSVEFCQRFSYLQHVLQSASGWLYQIMEIPITVQPSVSLSHLSAGFLSLPSPSQLSFPPSVVCFYGNNGRSDSKTTFEGKTYFTFRVGTAI